MKILFDVDGVLADFWSGYRSKIQQLAGKELPLIQEAWGFDKLGLTKEDDDAFWRYVGTSTTFWLNLPWLASRHAMTAINALAMEHDVYFVTKRFGPYAKHQTEMWLRTHGIYNPTVLLADKGKGGLAKHLGIEYALDDKPSNVWDMAQHCWAYILDAPHNKSWGGPWEKELRVKTVEEFIEILRQAVVQEQNPSPVPLGGVTPVE